MPPIYQCQLCSLSANLGTFQQMMMMMMMMCLTFSQDRAHIKFGNLCRQLQSAFFGSPPPRLDTKALVHSHSTALVKPRDVSCYYWMRCSMYLLQGKLFVCSNELSLMFKLWSCIVTQAWTYSLSSWYLAKCLLQLNLNDHPIRDVISLTRESMGGECNIW